MKKAILVGSVLISLLSTSIAKAEAERICVQQLEEKINQIVTRPEFRRSRWGILVKTENSEEVIYELDGENYFLPASSLKLLTTAAALEELGPEFKINTPIYTIGTIPHIKELRIEGRGDPSITSDKLRQLARNLSNQGIKSIEKLVVEDSYFNDFGVNPTWEWSDLYFYYGAAANSLILNENAVLLTVKPQKPLELITIDSSDYLALGQWQINNQVITVENRQNGGINFKGRFATSYLNIQGELATQEDEQVFGLAIHNPTDYFLRSLHRFLLLEGIEIETTAIVYDSVTNAEVAIELTNLTSPTLVEIITKINQESNNLYAEALGKIVKEESGLTISEILTELGVTKDSYQLADASGLSRHNLVSPQALVETLTVMAKSSLGETYRQSLATPATSQTTLTGRLESVELQGKTGYLTGVASLSGYLQPPDYSPLVFSIIVNQSAASGKVLQEAIDEIILLLNSLQTCQNQYTK